jgi:hypothetical protein
MQPYTPNSEQMNTDGFDQSLTVLEGALVRKA